MGALRTLVGANDPTLQIVSRAVPPESAAWPRPVLSVVVALLAGLLLGMGIAVAIELLNPLVLAETDVLERAGPPVLARVPRTAKAASAYRGLWANLTSRSDDRHAPEAVLVTGDGAPLVTVGLGTTLALAGRRVALVTLTGQWADLVGPALAAHTELRSLRDRILTIAVHAGPWATELKFLRGELRDRTAPEGSGRRWRRCAGSARQLCRAPGCAHEGAAVRRTAATADVASR